MKRRPVLFALAPAAALVAFLWPVIIGRETWFLRDLFYYHLTVKMAQAHAMREGFLPLVDPFRAGGQALVGNLNNVALYPDNLLYLFAPTLWALNAHLWLHLLLAPLAVYWLARAWNLAPEAAWAAGFCYALSGFFLSQLNLYNLTAGTALAPAFAAACLTAARGRRPGLAAVGAGVAWALILLAGDPILAALSLLIGVTAILFAARREARGLARLGLAVVLGTLLAAPQLVEFARILGSSYRGSLGLNTQSRLVASWDPRTAVELLIPLFFGAPDLRHWGEIVLRTVRPLYFSLYPGLLATALVLAGGRPRSRVAVWGWSLVVGGGFLALGGWNPLTFYLYTLPLADSLRYPIKAWILVAIGASVLAGLGFERTLLAGARRSLLLALAVVGAIAAAAWLALTGWGETAVDGLAARIAPFFPPALAAAEVTRWRGALEVSLVVVAAAAVLAAASRRTPRLAGGALVTLHVVSQLILLRPLLATDATRAYRDAPAALAFIEPGERVAHGCSFQFGCQQGRLGTYPGPQGWWRQRRAWLELFPYAGVPHGLRYAFNTSPDALDGVLSFAGNRAFRGLGDADGLRLLAASAVDVVLTNRAVEPAARDLVRLRARLPSLGGELFVYEIRDRAAEVRLAERVRGGDTGRVLLEILRPDFDPRRDVFLPGGAEAIQEVSGGDAVVRRRSWERLRIDTASSGDGMLVLGRAYLPLYRAAVDGVAVRTLQANMGLLAVPVPPGAHQVDVWVDRRPFLAALGGSVAGAAGLLALAFAARRRPAAEPTAPCQVGDRDGESAGSPGRAALESR